MKLYPQRRALWLCRIAVALMLLPIAAHAQSAVRPGGRAGVTRVTLVVSDIDKSVEFYSRIGLVKSADRAATDAEGVFGQNELPLTADSKNSRLVILSGAGDQSLALLWYDHPPLPSARGNLMGLGTGDVIVGIAVPDLQAAVGRLKQMTGGTRFQEQQPTHYRGVGSDGAPQSGDRIYAYDPDGHMVEISQFDASPK